jgi:6-pyruvoyltetrahydropterin/6-carboxytetrahydropterin synthase
LRRPLVSKHFLPELEGPENEVHVHRYKVEATVMGGRLDRCGFLVNVDLVAASLEKALKRFEGEILNEMPEFRGITPSMENIAKAIWSKLAADLDRSCVERIKVTIWEAEDICASFDEAC